MNASRTTKRARAAEGRIENPSGCAKYIARRARKPDTMTALSELRRIDAPPTTSGSTPISEHRETSPTAPVLRQIDDIIGPFDHIISAGKLRNPVL
jgi:hypothetical protein